MPLKPLFIALGLAFAASAHSANLGEVYRDALGYDAQYAAARAAYQAGLEKLPQGRAGLLPNVNLGGNLQWNDVNSDTPGADASYSSNGLALSAAQPLFRTQNQVQYEQAKLQVKLAETQLKIAEQDLILRTARAYFDVLQVHDNIRFTQAQMGAITEQLASAKRNFEVGTATIIDTNEAQARFDLASSQEIAEQNNLAIRQYALEKLIGKPATGLAPLDDKAKLKAPEPRAIEDWVGRADQHNLQAETQRTAKLIADQQVEFNRAGHYPTLDAVASYNLNNNQSVGSLGLVRTDIRTAVVGLQLNLPIYQGGRVSSQVREAVANQEKSRFDLENAVREASLQARQSYLNVTIGEARVRALEQALVSSQTQLDSTKLGMQVGVRTSLDVLNAEQQVHLTQRDLAAARYSVILAGLNLKAAAGTLNAQDLAEVDQYLRAPAAVK
jgi:outer membrane protein